MSDKRNVSTVTPADVEYLARAPELLVALDFDGTLAEFSTEPMDVRMVPGARESIDRLAGYPGTTVMLLSGRNLGMLQPVADISAVADPGPDDIRLVGSHGAEPAEPSLGTSDELSQAQRTLLGALGELAESFALRDPGLSVAVRGGAAHPGRGGPPDRGAGLHGFRRCRRRTRRSHGHRR